jgi:hypothetical protein
MPPFHGHVWHFMLPVTIFPSYVWHSHLSGNRLVLHSHLQCTSACYPWQFVHQTKRLFAQCLKLVMLCQVSKIVILTCYNCSEPSHLAPSRPNQRKITNKKGNICNNINQHKARGSTATHQDGNNGPNKQIVHGCMARAFCLACACSVSQQHC